MPKPAVSLPPLAPVTGEAAPVAAVTARYQTRDLLGQGGMGQVLLCHDGIIGRDVAMKRAHERAETSTVAAERAGRFLREARVQGQLEHPAVVPVYDLGVGEDGALFFTMKRVLGTTLEELLSRLARGDEELRAQHSRRKLLAAFSTVCLAVDFAHQRGVLHRDLKPANVMLGAFGEVYVLDWGLAKLAGDAAGNPPVAANEPLDSALGQTAEGLSLGTPGFMAPEQARGEVATLGPAADIYALGAILFEILALEPLHRGETALQLLFSTERGVDGRPSLRQPAEEVPPELDDLCQRATAHDPAARFPSARALHEALERYLDGDRDLAQRRALALTHAEAARVAVEHALRPREGDAGTIDEAEAESERRRALRETGRALALDPDCDVARHALLRLLTEPLRHTPAEAEDALRRSAEESVRQSLRYSGQMYLLWLFLLPVILWMGVLDWDTFLFTGPALSLCGFLNILAGTVHGRSRRVDLVLTALTILNNALVVVLSGRMFGPLIVTPSIALISVLAFSQHAERWARAVGPVTSSLGFIIPAVLGWLKILSMPYSYAADGGLVIAPQLFAFPPERTPVFLFLVGVGSVITAASTLGHARAGLLDAERRLHVQSWHLRQLLP